ncbi:hypothetical protein [Pseudoalteromonas marina]|uniref:Uncharacterized protein n=1 Tax=Pseudoalteromonas marina TaxID=267375 RepID=A0ABT9FGH6_9GAMM|nr:hypothetical protein [Pseudoalteromonas marina]MDP2565882.1 hypothetical protein [Pseudoalteromonas marina]
MQLTNAVEVYNASLDSLQSEVSIFLSELSGFFIATSSAGTFNSVMKSINPEFDILSLNAGVFQKFNTYQESFERAFKLVKKFPDDLPQSTEELKKEHVELKKRYDSYLSFAIQVKAYRKTFPGTSIDITNLPLSKSYSLFSRLFSKNKRIAHNFASQLSSLTGCNEFSDFLDLMVGLREKCSLIDVKIEQMRAVQEDKEQANVAYLEAKDTLNSYNVDLESMKWVFKIFQEPKVISALVVIDPVRATTVIDQFLKTRLLFNFLHCASIHIDLAESGGPAMGEMSSLESAESMFLRFEKVKSSSVTLGHLHNADYVSLASRYASKVSYETGVSVVGFLTSVLPEFSLNYKKDEEQSVAVEDDKPERLSLNFSDSLEGVSKSNSLLEA